MTSDGSMTDPLIIYDRDFFYTAKTAEFFIQVTLLGTDTKAEYTQDVRGIGRLLSLISITLLQKIIYCFQRTIGACGGRLGAGGERRR